LLVVAVAALAVGHAFLLLRIVSAGFGADNDTYLMLGTWDRLIEQHSYVPSRFQGSPVAELAIGITSEVGGHWLSAVLSMALGALTIISLFELARRRVGNRFDAALLASLLALTPLFLIAATTSHDYVYGLAAFFTAWNQRERGAASWWTVPLLALAALARLTYLPLGIVVLLMAPAGRTVHRGRNVAALILITGIGYLPAALSGPWLAAAFSADRPTGQGWWGIAVRAAVKPVTLFGSAGSILFVGVLVFAWAAARNASRNERERRREPWLLVLMGFCIASWIWLPAEPSYLLPAVGIATVWLAGRVDAHQMRPALLTLAALLVLLSWVEPRFTRVLYKDDEKPCVHEAVGATFEPRISAGQLWAYPNLVRERLSCNEMARAIHGDSP
jgi:MFS family permease